MAYNPENYQFVIDFSSAAHTVELSALNLMLLMLEFGQFLLVILTSHVEFQLFLC